jgi:hypothetical protein
MNIESHGCLRGFADPTSAQNSTRQAQKAAERCAIPKKHETLFVQTKLVN